MKRALFMTLGTGVGPNQDVKISNLAHGLLKSIRHYNPNKIVFFGSRLSSETLKSLKEQYAQKIGEKLSNYEFVEISAIDKFDECFGAIKKKIAEYDDYEVIIDYTSGTKTMTMSAAICSVLYRKSLSFISGKRGNNGLVKTGTEKVRPQNLYSVYDNLSFEKMNNFFNNYRFEVASDTLEEIVDLENKEAYKKFIMAYDYWDKFDHTNAREYLMDKELNDISQVEDTLASNRKFIGTLTDPKERPKGEYMVSDLLNNAQRRGKEIKYDDAVARLYRVIELIAQCRLKEKHEINTSDVDVDKIPSNVSFIYEKLRNKNGTIKIGLHKSYELLRYLDDELGIKFTNDRKLKDLLTKRNASILAHGLTPISKEDFKGLNKKSLEFAMIVFPKIEDLMKKAEFPVL